jgi:hypothetical protein
MTPSKRIIALLAILLLGSSALTAAAKEGDPMAEGGDRHLNGHGFMPSIYVNDPFVSTLFQTHTGGGTASNLTATYVDADGNELFTVEGDLFFAALGLGFQQKIGSKWAVGAAGTGLVRSGSSASSFLVEGADVDRQGNLWAKYRLMRGEKSQVSLGLDWTYSKVTYFTPGDFARNIAAGGSIEDAPLVINTKIWTGRLTVNWARAFSPGFAVRFNGEIGMYEVPETSGIFKGSHRVGILAEYDLKASGLEWPVGITLGYSQNLPDDDPFTGLGGTLLGFWYTGKKDFVVGLETGSMKLNVDNQETQKVDAMFAIITLKYYF